MQIVDTKTPQTNLELIAVRAFQAGDLSLGQVALVFAKPKAETMRLLAELGVPIADYDLAEDLETLARGEVTEQSAARGLPSLAAFRATLPPQTVSAGDLCREMRDEDRY